MSNRIEAAFERARSQNAAAFMPFITAGDPDLATTAAVIEEMARRGADLVEVGVPYSDPVADGPTIQASYVRALASGFKVAQLFDTIKDLRMRCQVPILTMVSFSIVSRMGPANYFLKAASAGVDGVIIPDLPADEGGAVTKLAEAAGLCPVLLLAPTTPDERVQRIVRHSRGFIYYISVTGTTGARRELPPDLADHIARIKALTGTPVAVGFGVSDAAQVASVARVADGVIVGSAIVRKMGEFAGRPRAELVQGVGDFVAQLAEAKKRG